MQAYALMRKLRFQGLLHLFHASAVFLPEILFIHIVTLVCIFVCHFLFTLLQSEKLYQVECLHCSECA